MVFSKINSFVTAFKYIQFFLEVLGMENKTLSLTPNAWFFVLAIAGIQILGEFTENEILKMLKPIPIMCLIYIALKEKKFLPMTGLCFSIIGDIMLMVHSDNMFMAGTEAFLVGHICYVMEFITRRNWNFKITARCIIIGAITLISIVYVANMIDLWNKTPNFPLFATYGAMLCLTMITSLFTFKNNKNKGYLLTVCGAILFGVSDNLIAVLKFHNLENNIGDGLIMLTYYSSQLLILRGIIKSDEMEKEDTI